MAIKKPEPEPDPEVEVLEALDVESDVEDGEQSRTYTVPADDRTFVVPADDRTFYVLCKKG